MWKCCQYKCCQWTSRDWNWFRVQSLKFKVQSGWGSGLMLGDWGLDWTLTTQCRTNDRGQKTKDWAGRRFAFNSHHPLSSVFCPLSLNSMMWQGRLCLATSGFATRYYDCSQIATGTTVHKSQIAIAGGRPLCQGECCQCGSVAIPMLPVGNWGVGLVQSSKFRAAEGVGVDIDNSMKRHCRTNDRGQRTKDWAGGRVAFNSQHPLACLFWNCEIVRMRHYGIVALALELGLDNGNILTLHPARSRLECGLPSKAASGCR